MPEVQALCSPSLFRFLLLLRVTGEPQCIPAPVTDLKSCSRLRLTGYAYKVNLIRKDFKLQGFSFLSEELGLAEPRANVRFTGQLKKLCTANNQALPWEVQTSRCPSLIMWNVSMFRDIVARGGRGGGAG